jgi:hypothetical protein
MTLTGGLGGARGESAGQPAPPPLNLEIVSFLKVEEWN